MIIYDVSLIFLNLFIFTSVLIPRERTRFVGVVSHQRNGAWRGVAPPKWCIAICIQCIYEYVYYTCMDRSTPTARPISSDAIKLREFIQNARWWASISVNVNIQIFERIAARALSLRFPLAASVLRTNYSTARSLNLFVSSVPPY